MNLDEFRALLPSWPDGELTRALGEFRAEYPPERLEAIEAEAARRQLGAAPLREHLTTYAELPLTARPKTPTIELPGARIGSCPYCREEVPVTQRHVCPKCLAVHHAECAGEFARGCVSCGHAPLLVPPG